MTARYLLDTNMVIHIRQRRPIATLEKFEGLAVGVAALSVITYGELLVGIEKSINREGGLAILRELTRLIPVLPLPVQAGEAYGGIRSTLERQGNVIGSNDLWIAAHALAANLVLVTNNWSEFSRVPQLQLENWVT